MTNVVEFQTKEQSKEKEDRAQLDKIVSELTRLHSEGKLRGILAYYVTTDGENYTWSSRSLKMDEYSWGITLLQHSLFRLIGKPE